MAKKIMIIDDDPDIVTYLTDLFTDSGYATCSAADGAQALDVVKAERPDCITLDIEMPDEWGPRFYRKLSQEPEFRKIPVIVISGLNATKYAVPKAAANFSKPFDREELLATVRQIVD
ncbi:MAG: response regulator [Desulfovibrionaceae bacterium]|nr:response regulator [Desulfovibrionaceae bacterium]